METWLPIPGYEGRYEISSLGRVKSLTRRATGVVKYLVTERILVLENHSKGYKVIQLRQPGKRNEFFIHRLVADVFLHNPLRKPVVNHIDCDKKNNAVSNLEWMTFAENTQYYFLHKHDTTVSPVLVEGPEDNSILDHALSHF